MVADRYDMECLMRIVEYTSKEATTAVDAVGLKPAREYRQKLQKESRALLSTMKLLARKLPEA